ncbi:MAG: cyclic nucleotide-binding domain-containing protein [Pseudonocardiales bacterium]|nr:cyclic nucleotide-binding domain-containing protein [Pseudonocardiales bacterium]
MTTTDPNVDGTEQSRLSLSTAAARTLATTTKSVPQMRGITPRWLLRRLPWVEVSGGTYRVNRRLTYPVGDGRVTFTTAGAEVRVIPEELCELPVLRGFDDAEVLGALAGRFVQRELEAGNTIAQEGQPADQVFLIVHGKVNKIGPGKYGEPSMLDILADGDYFGDQELVESQDTWSFSVKAVTPCTVLAIPRQAFEEILGQSEALRAHVERFRVLAEKPTNKKGEADIELTSGHEQHADLTATFVDYDTTPREYELSVAQTVLRVHTRVADLYNNPMNQVEQQLRLTIEALRERQEHELLNNHEFGLLHNADLTQRISTRTGPPTPEDLDELLARRRKTRFFLAHPRTIAAVGRECNRRGIYPQTVDIDGQLVMSWRGVPIFPCDKIPITQTRTSSILAFRTGVEDEGVIGLRQTGIPDEIQPGLNVRFMGISDKAIISYLVSTYYSVAVLVPDALGILENVEISRYEQRAGS